MAASPLSVGIIASNGKYLRVKNKNLVADSGTPVIFALYVSGNKVGFRSEAKKFVCAQTDGTIVVNRPEMLEWESFTREPAGQDQWCFKSHHGKYLCVLSNGTVLCNAAQPGEWETFSLVELAGAKKSGGLWGAVVGIVTAPARLALVPIDAAVKLYGGQGFGSVLKEAGLTTLTLGFYNPGGSFIDRPFQKHPVPTGARLSSAINQLVHPTETCYIEEEFVVVGAHTQPPAASCVPPPSPNTMAAREASPRVGVVHVQHGDIPVVVIDCGSRYIKAGFAGYDAPQLVFPSVIGKPRPRGYLASEEEIAVGKVVEYHSFKYDVVSAFTHGMVSDWTAMNMILQEVFRGLDVSPSDHRVLVTHNLLDEDFGTECTKSLLHNFAVKGAAAYPSAIVALYSVGTTTGLSVEVGEYTTRVIPVIDGHIQPQAVVTSTLAGSSLTEALRLACHCQEPSSFPSGPSTEARMREMKKTVLGVDLNHGECVNKEVVLADGTAVKLGLERTEIPEMLFVGGGIPAFVDGALDKLSAEDRARVVDGGVVLSGASMAIPGLADHVAAELQAQFDIRECVTNTNAVWQGGAILAAVLDDQYYSTEVL